MRRVTFQSVYEGILRRHGIDPAGDAVTHDTAGAIVEHINDRVRVAYSLWPFPELTVTEERAFRTIWNATRQFYRDDELFFIPNATYVHVKTDAPSDPPVGTQPFNSSTDASGNTIWTINATYYEVLSPVDTYVAYDQVCKRPIGQALGVYSRNPRMRYDAYYAYCPQDICLAFRPSEKGIDVFYAQGPTVFVHYMMPEPIFTAMPYIAGKIYARGGRVLFTDGDCYRSLTDANSAAPTDLTYWALEPFPAVLSLWVKAGAYADCLRETILDGVDADTRLARLAAADEEANRFVQGEVDNLIAQGQTLYYTKPHRYPPGLVVTQPWTGATVSELTDECEGDWVFPPQPISPQVVWQYHPEIVSLRGPATPSLAGLPTSLLLLGSKVEIVIGNQQQVYQLRFGPADPADPGHVAPGDYSSTNNKHWERIG